jgi:hypothetical protein
MKIGSLLRRIPLKSRLASVAATRPLEGRKFRELVPRAKIVLKDIGRQAR